MTRLGTLPTNLTYSDLIAVACDRRPKDPDAVEAAMNWYLQNYDPDELTQELVLHGIRDLVSSFRCRERARMRNGNGNGNGDGNGSRNDSSWVPRHGSKKGQETPRKFNHHEHIKFRNRVSSGQFLMELVNGKRMADCTKTDLQAASADRKAHGLGYIKESKYYDLVNSGLKKDQVVSQVYNDDDLQKLHDQAKKSTYGS